MGGHSESCGDCGTRRFVPHSCRHALCASCHDAEIDDWLAARADELLPVPYFHLTFPLPAELRDAARRQYAVVCGAMLQAAAEALQTLAADRLGGRLGITAVLHTWGRTLPWHPHVHCVVPGVVALPDGDFRKVAANYLLPVRPLSEIYRAVFLRRVRSHRDGPDLPRLDWSKQWIANCRACEEGPGNVLRYLARYTKRGPLPEKSVVSVSDQTIVFRYTSHRTGRRSLCKLAPEEFLRRYLQHTPLSGFHRIRYFGFLAPGARRTLAALRGALFSELATLEPVLARLRERRDARPCYVCPCCGGQTFVRMQFTSPNRRAPPWQHVA